MKIRCHFGWHRWRLFHTVDGERYAKCTRCGKVRDIEGWPPLVGGGIGAGGISPPNF